MSQALAQCSGHRISVHNEEEFAKEDVVLVALGIKFHEFSIALLLHFIWRIG